MACPSELERSLLYATLIAAPRCIAKAPNRGLSPIARIDAERAEPEPQIIPPTRNPALTHVAVSPADGGSS
jgi:hypothetical protein